MKKYRKQHFDPANTRRLLEPGPVVLVTSAWNDQTNIMTMGWHMMIGFTPPCSAATSTKATTATTWSPTARNA